MTTRAPRWPIPDGVQTIDVDGYPIAYRETGSGEPLILVHGSFNDYRAWKLQLQVLGQRYRVIAPSLRHYHPEPWDGAGDTFSIAQHADDIAGLVRALKLPSAHVVGHSRGGGVVLDVLRRHPQVLSSVVLADPRGLEDLLPPSPESTRLAAELQTLFATLKVDLQQRSHDEAAKHFVDAIAGKGAWVRRSPELRAMFFDNLATAVDTGATPGFSADDVARIDTPLLLLTGSQSPRRYGEMLAALSARLARPAETIVIPNAGHAMHLENPAAFNQAILEFLAHR